MLIEHSGKLLFLALFLIIGLSLIYAIYHELPSAEDAQIKKFASCEELKNFVEASSETFYYGYSGSMRTAVISSSVSEEAQAVSKDSAQPSAVTGDYSTTNIQVEGVDEADIVKNDGKYIYTVSGNKIVIADAYPAESARILSEIEINGTSEIFINSDKLVVFGGGGYYGPYFRASYYSGNTFVRVYDVSDRENPVLKRDLTVNGSYFDSRMIGDYVYVIVNQPIYRGDVIPLPVVASGGAEKAICNCPDVYYFDVPDYSRRFTTIMAVNTQNDDEEVSGKVFVTGDTQNIYVSMNNIYVTYMKWLNQYDYTERIMNEAVLPFVSGETRTRVNQIMEYNISSYSKWQEISNVLQGHMNSLSTEERAAMEKQMQEKMTQIMEELAKEMEKTIIHKISIDNGNVEYVTQGYAPGNVLNQFSMDENRGYFRIATTTTGYGSSNSKNHVYVLDGDLNIVGRLEDLASGERIYSVRFIGSKGYMVTFRQIDPLFVIDLEDPTSPRVLGYLKIPGVSDYLHPYDETHIIGLGRDATEEGRMLGMKLSLFDVTEVENPKEVSKYMIGERGTSSEALNDHKAFLFSREKGILVIPVSLVEDDRWNAWNGAYVFSLDLDNGFVLKGKVTHSSETAGEDDYYYDYQHQIRRSLYIENILYTVSQKMIKMNSLDDVSELNELELPYEEYNNIYPLYEDAVE